MSDDNFSKGGGGGGGGGLGTNLSRSRALVRYCHFGISSVIYSDSDSEDTYSTITANYSRVSNTCML